MIKYYYRKFLSKNTRDQVWYIIFSIRFFVATPLFITKKIFRYFFLRYIYNSDSTKREIKTLVSKIEFFSANDLASNLQKLFKSKIKSGFSSYYFYDPDIYSKINPVLDKYSTLAGSVGIKIHKNTSIGFDGTPYAVSENSNSFLSIVTGSALEKIIISNMLSFYELTPKVYEIYKLQSNNCSVFISIVENIKYEKFEVDKALNFLKRFKETLKLENLKMIGGINTKELSPPDFGGNIIFSKNKFYFVDLQNITFDKSISTKNFLSKQLNKTHFGAKNFLKKNSYSYQSNSISFFSGKRDTSYRKYVIKNILDKNKINFSNFKTLDVGCNLGTFTQYSMDLGSLWSIGIDTPDIAEVSRRYLNIQGYCNFDILGCNLKRDNLLDKLRLNYFDFIFYLSIEGHIGFPDWIKKIEFIYFLYEGHEGESIETINSKFHKHFTTYSIIHKDYIQDGDSFKRPLILYKKND